MCSLWLYSEIRKHSDEVLLKKWMVAIRRESFVPSKHSHVCSKHFLQSDYYPGGSRELLKNSVPSVFDFPERLQKKRKSSQAIGKKAQRR